MIALAVASCPAAELVENVQRWPGTGEPSFPPNGVVFATYAGAATELASPGLAIVDDAGTVVPSTTTALTGAGPNRHDFLVVPAQPLAPSTKYYLGDTVDWQCAAEPCRVAFRETTVFTTSAAADTTPTPAPEAAIGTQTIDACADASCTCGTYHGLVTTLANPATGAVRFDLYDDGAVVERNAPFVVSTDCAQPGDVPYPAKSSVPLAAGHHHLTWHGFDLAGNETAGTQALDLDLECPAVTPPDANLGSGSDGGIGSGNGERGGGGCSAGGGAAPWAPIAFAAAALLSRRRRRR